MKKEKGTTKKVKMEDDCGGLKPYNPIKPPKKATQKATKKSK